MSTSKEESIGERLKRLRKAKGWSQTELAREIDTQSQNINRWENNKGLPQLYHQRKLAEKFDLSIEAIFSLQKDNEEGEATSPKIKRRDNRPVTISNIFGRDEKIAEIVNLIQKGERFITLVGTGGVGKTRLTLEITRIIDQHEYADLPSSYGFVDLTKVKDPDAVPGFVATELGTQYQGEAKSIIDVLPPEPFLLVIDNIEHVLPMQQNFFLKLVQASMTQKKPIVFLFTSRIPFNVRGEKHVLVDPLSLPKDISLICSVEDLRYYAATQLFYECAREWDAARRFTEIDAQYMARLCQALDGLPLAIEIAASNIINYPCVQALYEDMNSKGIFAFDTRYSNFDERHSNLLETLRWSYDLLSEQEQKLFSRLSLFPSGCTIDAADHICNSERDIAADKEAIERILDMLVKKSLLKRDYQHLSKRKYSSRSWLSPSSWDFSRYSSPTKYCLCYSMLQTIAVFAQKKMEENSKEEEYEELQARFAIYYLIPYPLYPPVEEWANRHKAYEYYEQGLRQENNSELWKQLHKVYLDSKASADALRIALSWL